MRSHQSYEEYLTQYPSQKAAVSASSTTTPDWEPVHWRPQYQKMVEMTVEGLSIGRIQRAFRSYGVKYSGRQISRVLNSQKGREMLSIVSAHKHGGREGLVTHLGMFLPEMLGVEIDIARHPFEATRHRLNAAQDIMDRGALPKISRQEQNALPPQTIVINLLPSQMSSFLLPPPVIDAEIVEIQPDLPSDD